eukprot:gene23197-biopygen7267
MCAGTMMGWGGAPRGAPPHHVQVWFGRGRSPVAAAVRCLRRERRQLGGFGRCLSPAAAVARRRPALAGCGDGGKRAHGGGGSSPAQAAFRATARLAAPGAPAAAGGRSGPLRVTGGVWRRLLRAQAAFRSTERLPAPGAPSAVHSRWQQLSAARDGRDAAVAVVAGTGSIPGHCAPPAPGASAAVSSRGCQRTATCNGASVAATAVTTQVMFRATERPQRQGFWPLSVASGGSGPPRTTRGARRRLLLLAQAVFRVTERLPAPGASAAGRHRRRHQLATSRLALAAEARRSGGPRPWRGPAAIVPAPCGAPPTKAAPPPPWWGPHHQGVPPSWWGPPPWCGPPPWWCSPPRWGPPSQGSTPPCWGPPPWWGTPRWWGAPPRLWV